MSTTHPTDPFMLAAERNRAGIPPQILARKLRVSRSELSNFERGRRPLPDPDRPGHPFGATEAARVYMATVRAIARFLDEPVKQAAA